MIQLLASTRSKEYPVFLSVDALDQVGRLWGAQGRSGKVVVITDGNVAPLYLQTVQDSFAAAGFGVDAVQVEAGESAKSLSQAAELYSRFFHLRTRRRDAVCALGGGVVGDLSGFVASTYMRGIGLIQAPTSLLAQVDSSVGGKTGVNIDEAKNYVGSFYQPDMVLADPAVLKTLPGPQLVEGLAEVVKYALLKGDDFFEALEGSHEDLLRADMAFLEPVIRRCIEYKLRVVSEDEREQGRRAVLNLGHSVGHGIEAAGGYRLYSHGRAVALGLMAALWLSEEYFALPESYSVRLLDLLRLLELPTAVEGIEPEAILMAMASDKKADDLSANMVLLKRPGSPVINCDVDAARLRRVVERLVSGS